MPVSPPPASLPGAAGGTGSLSYAGSYGGDYGGYGGDSSGYGGGNPADYLRQLYEESLNAQLAALRAAYEQNTADYQAHDDLIAQVYRNQRNQAAAQNDLQRMYMAELGTAQGLNTGAAGQLALARSAAYQGQLAELLAAEGQDRAENDLALRKLAAAYRGDTASARAQNSTELLRALYSEAVRQEDVAREEAWRRQQMEYQRRQDALAQQNWQTQWDYNLQADARDSAYNLAAALLKNGVLPDSATLAAAGISQGDAQAYVNAVRAQLTAKSTGTSGGSSDSYKPKLTWNQLLAALESGQTGADLERAYDYYRSPGAYANDYGTGTETTGGAGMNSAYFTQMGKSLSTMMAQGNKDAAASALDKVWGRLSSEQRNQIQTLFNRYGYTYHP